MSFDFSTLEAEFEKLEGYVSQGAALVAEVPAALDVAMKDVAAVKTAFNSLKTSVATATAAVAAAPKAAS